MRFFIRNRYRVKSFSFSDVREKKGRRTRSPIWPVWTDARAVDGEEANIFQRQLCENTLANNSKKLPQIMIPLDNCPPENCHFTLIGDRQVRQLKEMISIYSQAQRNLISVIKYKGATMCKSHANVYMLAREGTTPASRNINLFLS